MSAHPIACDDPHSRRGGGDGELPQEAPQASSSQARQVVIADITVRKKHSIHTPPSLFNA